MSTAADFVGLAIVVALAATVVPAIRAARSSTFDALNDVARPPRRRGRLIRLSNRLPVPALFGLRLVALAVRNALFTTWPTVLDARHSSALMGTLGARARQVTSGLVVAQVLSALPGAILGVPPGFGLFTAAVHGGGLPTVSWLVAMVIGTLIAMAALTVVPAQLGTRQPVAEVLASEAA